MYVLVMIIHDYPCKVKLYVGTFFYIYNKIFNF